LGCTLKVRPADDALGFQPEGTAADGVAACGEPVVVTVAVETTGGLVAGIGVASLRAPSV